MTVLMWRIACCARAFRALLLASILMPGVWLLPAQNVPPGAPDSVFRRAQRMANDGNAQAARALVDSMLAASREGSAEYADALFWRATLAESAEQARRDYLRLAVEFSLSPRAEDALLRLAQIELARGDRVAARKHLERLALEHPSGTSRAPAAYWLGRVLFDEGAMAAGCASLAEARARVSGSDVELSNQISYYARQCVSVQRAVDAARVDSVARADSISKVAAAAHADSIIRAASAFRKRGMGSNAESHNVKREAPRGPTWSAQVAAYSTRDDADRLAKRLQARGFDVRVTPETPFRVRIGRFTRRSDAATLVQKLKDAKMTAIVVEGERP